MRADVAVVGAGIVGLASARELARRHPRLRLVIIDREPAVGRHQTAHNSGVVHAGIYYRAGSMKARLCVEGSRLLRDYCAERQIPLHTSGKLIVATRNDELDRLRALLERAHANGVAGVRWLRGEEIPELEPHVRGLAAIHSPTTAVVDYTAVAERLASELRADGHEILLGVEVTDAAATRRGVRLRHGPAAIEARRALFCAGAWSDRLAIAAGARSDPRIVPFRGSYLLLRPERRHLVRSLVYPVPDPGLPFLGVHLTRHIDGAVSVGPTALLVASRAPGVTRRARWADARATALWPGTWRMAWQFRRAAFREIGHALDRRRLLAEAARYVPALDDDAVLPGPAGIRAQALARDGRLVEDFAFSETPRALHVRNAPSPAATAALAIAREIADRFAPQLDGR